MERLPPEIQENILREVIQQKVEDKKRMGWEEIHKIICCENCIHLKKKKPEHVIKPSKLAIVFCEKCFFNCNADCSVIQTIGPGCGELSCLSNGVDVILTPTNIGPLS